MLMNLALEEDDNLILGIQLGISRFIFRASFQVPSTTTMVVAVLLVVAAVDTAAAVFEVNLVCSSCV